MGFNRNVLLFGGLTAATLTGVTGCAASTDGPRSAATPPNSCIPGGANYEMVKGDWVDTAVKDISHRSNGETKVVRDTLHIEALGATASKEVDVIRLTVDSGHALSISPLSEEMPFAFSLQAEDEYDIKVDRIRNSRSHTTEVEVGEGDVRTVVSVTSFSADSGLVNVTTHFDCLPAVETHN